MARQVVEKVEPTDTQLAKLTEILSLDPWKGHVTACRQAGVQGTMGQLRAWARESEWFQRTLDQARGDAWEQCGLGAPTLFRKLGEIVAKEGPSQLRAVTDALAIAHGISPRQLASVEVTGGDGGPVQVSHEQRLTLAHVAALAGQLNGPGSSARAELPAPGDVLAAVDEGESSAGRVLPQ